MEIQKYVSLGFYFFKAVVHWIVEVMALYNFWRDFFNVKSFIRMIYILLGLSIRYYLNSNNY